MAEMTHLAFSRVQLCAFFDMQQNVCGRFDFRVAHKDIALLFYYSIFSMGECQLAKGPLALSIYMDIVIEV